MRYDENSAEQTRTDQNASEADEMRIEQKRREQRRTELKVTGEDKMGVEKTRTELHWKRRERS